MVNFWYFGQRLIAKLRLTQKFQLILGLLAFPIVYAFWQLVATHNQDIRVWEAELQGQQLIAAVHPLQLIAAEHRGKTVAWLAGSELAADDLPNIRNKLEQAFQHAIKVANDKGYPKISRELSSIFHDWKSMVDHLSMNVPANKAFSQHSDWINRISIIVDTIATDSGLILDPKLNTFLAMDIFVYQLPLLFETTGKLRGKGSLVAAKGQFTPELFIEVTRLTEVMEETYKKVVAQITALGNYSDSYQKRIEPYSNQLSKVVNDFILTSRSELLKNDSPSIAVEDFFNNGSTAIKAQMDFYLLIEELFVEGARQHLAETQNKRNMVITVFSVTMLSALYLLVCYQINTRLAINKLLYAANSLELGQLNIQLEATGQDELSEAINATGRAMNLLRQKVKALADEAVVLNQTAQALDQESDTNQQSGNDQKQRISHIVELVRHSTDSAQSMLELADETSHHVQNVYHSVEESSQQSIETANVSHRLAEQINDAAQQIIQLANSANNISNVIHVIREVAEQTNLLALNAAIEAARAGEQGQGFAVVAEEVRTLATRTQEATNEISQSILNLQQIAEDAVKVMEASSSDAATSEERTRNTGDALQKVTEATNQVAAAFQKVAEAANIQASTAADINSHIDSVNQSASNLVSSAKRVAESANSVHIRSKNIEDIVSGFKFG
ncbi:methyl-accepting chemotaxis protein [Spartinivicinus ruber]|uniref:methyl-accepting chemotaxis protein n=1 Tax=Spartinivicinus ruber TaxID=2683272 RepID=UPI0013CF55DD|nr:methyl-accepting chemotaxis protein [Spartinivicinus ruber]